MLELKVRKIGNSLGVVLPREAVSRFQAGEGDRLFLIEGSNGAYQLTPYDPSFEKKMKPAEDIIGRYRNTLRRPRCHSTLDEGWPRPRFASQPCYFLVNYSYPLYLMAGLGSYIPLSARGPRS